MMVLLALALTWSPAPTGFRRVLHLNRTAGRIVVMNVNGGVCR